MPNWELFDHDPDGLGDDVRRLRDRQRGVQVTHS
jgi:hypothetical protein